MDVWGQCKVWSWVSLGFTFLQIEGWGQWGVFVGKKEKKNYKIILIGRIVK